MNTVIWKVSGLLFLTTTLVGLMGGLLATSQSRARTRKKIHTVFQESKDRMTHGMHNFKESVANVAKPGVTSRKHWLPGKKFSEWEEGFMTFPSIAPAKITAWPSKEPHK